MLCDGLCSRDVRRDDAARYYFGGVGRTAESVDLDESTTALDVILKTQLVRLLARNGMNAP